MLLFMLKQVGMLIFLLVLVSGIRLTMIPGKPKKDV